MKCDLQPELAHIDLNTGLAINSGWVTVYHYSEITGEFFRASYEYILEGTGLPAHSCLDKPEQNDGKEKAIIRVNNEWQYLPDHRGITAYSKDTGQSLIINVIGDIPDNYTLLKPASEFDMWNGEKWVLDAEKKHKYYVDVAQNEKTKRLNDITQTISYLQDTADTEIATEEEKVLLQKFKKYRVLLNHVNVNNAPNLDWPEKPQ